MQNETPSWFNWLTVAAIILGPILAVISQRVIDALREKHSRRAQVFFTLMSTRAALLLRHLSPPSVVGVNRIVRFEERE